MNAKLIKFAALIIIVFPLLIFHFQKQSFSVDSIPSVSSPTTSSSQKIHRHQEGRHEESGTMDMSSSSTTDITTQEERKTMIVPEEIRTTVSGVAFPTKPQRQMSSITSSRCRELAAHADVQSAFQIHLCYTREFCKASLHILHHNCSAGGKRHRSLSVNATFSSWIRTVHGPDEFRLRLEGPEVHAMHSTFLGECQYAFYLPELKHSGVYQIGLEWLYDNYFSLDELTNHFPPIKKQPLLRLPDEPFRTNYHLQQCTLPSVEEIVCQRTENQEHEEKGEGLASCNGKEPDTSGRWVLDQPQGIVYSRVRVKKIRKHPILFQWALQSNAAYHWVPRGCHLHRINLAKAQTALKMKKVVIGGDSQLRALYYTVVNFLNGYGVPCVRNISTVENEPGYCIANVKGSQRKSVYSIQLHFVDDHYLDKLPGGRYDSYDILILGFAQHPASKEHWAFDKYRKHVHRRAEHISKLTRQGKHVLWYLAPQYPHTKQGYPVVVRDWRTDARLQLFNNYSASIMHQFHVPIIDAFSISTPMSHTSTDQAHFSNFVAFEFVNMVLNVICAQLQVEC